MRRHQILSIPVVLCVAVLAVACGGSDTTSNAAATPTPSHTKPAHDLRINSQLEKYVTDEWNHNIASPGDANYTAGVTVTKVTCVPQTGTTISSCFITFSGGPPRKQNYTVAEDGGSAERSDNGG